jgi:hypothetical protein
MELYETLVYGGAKGRGWVPEEQRFYHDEVIVQTSRPSNYWREKFLRKADQHVDDFDGFWGKVNHVLSGGISGNGKYNWDGDLIGFAPISGTAPIPNFGKVKNVKNMWTLAKKLRKSAFKNQGPQSVNRVDIPGKGINGETIHNQMPHVHLKDGRAFNLDGTWKHGEGNISNQIINWLNKFL